MAVVKIRPDRLSYFVPGKGYEDEEGNYHPGEPSWEGDIPCDAVTSGKAAERTFEDGVIRAYSYEVTLPANTKDFAIGDRVRILFYGGVEREFEVKGFDRKQHQCKLWV